MPRPALRIGVTAKDQKALRKLLRGGVQQVRVVLRAVALLHLAKGVSAPRVSAVVPLTPQAIRKVGHRYQQGGLERALYEKERPGAAALLAPKLYPANAGYITCAVCVASAWPSKLLLRRNRLHRRSRMPRRVSAVSNIDRWRRT